MFPQAKLDITHDNSEFFCFCAILTSFNNVATEINTELLHQMHGEEHLRFAKNTAEVEDSTLQKYFTESAEYSTSRLAIIYSKIKE